MPDRHLAIRQKLIDAVLTTPGETDSALRRQIEARAARLAGVERPVGDAVPEALRPYLDKVARHAYKVTDEDVQALQEQGYSEDAILEITLSAALGAGMSRLERGLAALKGATS